MNSPVIFIAGFVGFLLALTVHEYCHALTAYLLGDETAYRAGRLTLNPMAHLDPVGTVLIPLFGALSGLPVFGWAKPVPFNPYNLRQSKRDAILIAAAGPVSNYLMAILALTVLRLLIGTAGLGLDNLLVLFMVSFAGVNIVLGTFNLIPVPPLDGSRFLQAVLDAPKYRRTLYWLETRGNMLLIGLLLIDYLLPGVAPLSRLLNGALGLFFGVFGM